MTTKRTVFCPFGYFWVKNSDDSQIYFPEKIFPVITGKGEWLRVGWDYGGYSLHRREMMTTFKLQVVYAISLIASQTTLSAKVESNPASSWGAANSCGAKAFPPLQLGFT